MGRVEVNVKLGPIVCVQCGADPVTHKIPCPYNPDGFVDHRWAKLPEWRFELVTGIGWVAGVGWEP